MVRVVICLVITVAVGCGRDKGTRSDAAAPGADATSAPDLSPDGPPEARPSGSDAADGFPADASSVDAAADASPDLAAGGDAGARDVGAQDAGADVVDASPVDTRDASAPDTRPATLVTVQFTGKVATVAGMPLGLDGT